MEYSVGYTPACKYEDITLRFKVSRYKLDNEIMIMIEACDELTYDLLTYIKPLMLSIGDYADMPDITDPAVCDWIIEEFQGKILN